ncbi:MAG TPA: hypothetical protein VHJ77_08615 [Vicinamibacterales bacterium]|jgi:hypothetical protein|nr:hypothetical protein [Vicinamibacterales bacterium]
MKHEIERRGALDPFALRGICARRLIQTTRPFGTRASSVRADDAGDAEAETARLVRIDRIEEPSGAIPARKAFDVPPCQTPTSTSFRLPERWSVSPVPGLPAIATH